jgi:hypothetical protein
VIMKGTILRDVTQKVTDVLPLNIEDEGDMFFRNEGVLLLDCTASRLRNSIICTLTMIMVVVIIIIIIILLINIIIIIIRSKVVSVFN